MATEVNQRPLSNKAAATLEETPIYCALTGRKLQPEEAYWAPPLITASLLISTILRTLFNAPADLGRVLMEEQPNVPYAPEARELLARRRSTEQFKLLMVLLGLIVLIVLPIILLTLR